MINLTKEMAIETINDKLVFALFTKQEQTILIQVAGK